LYAVIRTGGKQYRVEKGDKLKIEKLEVEAGQAINFEDILLVGDQGKVVTGAADLKKASVTGTVLANGKGKKIIVFKYKSKKGYSKKYGHRQLFTEVQIDDIKMAKAAARKKKAEEPAPVEEPVTEPVVEIETAEAVAEV
jgi:large subunit ribosomal protein L21